MGMWQGIGQGLAAVEQRKITEKELELRAKAEERLEKQFNQEMKDRRLKQIVDLGGYVRGSKSGKVSKDARADAEAVVIFKNRMEAASKNLSVADQERIQNYTNQLTASPEKTSEVLTAWNKLNSSGSNIQITEIPEIFQIISFTGGDKEQTKLTLEELYNVDLTDDKVYEDLLKAAATSSQATVVVDYDTARTGVRKPEELRAQYQFILPIVINEARAAQTQTDRPDVQEITAALNNVNSSDEAVAAKAQSILFEKFFSLERAQALESGGSIYYRGITENPYVAPFLTSKEPQVNTVNIPESAITALRNNPSLKEQFESKYGVGSSEPYLQPTGE